MMTRAAILLIVAAGCGQRYLVNEAASNVPNVFLHRVSTSGDATELVLRVEAEEAFDVGVAPAGFRLRAGDRTFALTEVSGAGAVEARGSRRLTLEFEPLPEEVRAFEVEGELSGIGPVAFAVRLDAPNVVTRRW